MRPHICFLLLCFTAWAGIAPGQNYLDPDFGQNGIAILNLGEDDQPQAAALGPDGTLAIAGTTYNPFFFGGLGVARLLPDGQPDSAFSGDGIQTFRVANANTYGHGIAVQPDGKVLAMISLKVPAGFDTRIFRWLPDGAPDSSFGQAGLANAGFAQPNDGIALVLQEDGKIAGLSSALDPFFRKTYGFFRLSADGSPDTTFGTGGVSSVEVPGAVDIAPFNLVAQPDGKLLGTGHSFDGSLSAFQAIRLKANGQLDSTFGTDGLLRLPTLPGSNEGCKAAAVRSDGKLLLAGYAGTAAGLLSGRIFRLMPDGRPDSTFDSDGVLDLPFGTEGGTLNSMLLLPDNGMLLGGFKVQGGINKAMILYLREDGTPEASFGSDGMLVVDLGFANSGVNSLLARGGGRYIAVGPAYMGFTPSNDFGVFQFQLTPATPITQDLDAGGLSIYPNPARGAVTATIPAPGAGARLSLLDGMGRSQPVRVIWTRQEAGSSTWMLDTGHLPAGMYTLLISAGGRHYRERFVAGTR